MYSYKDKLVLITGASTGLGARLAEAFSRAGARLALVARSQEKLDQLIKKFDPSGARCQSFPGDLRRLDQIAGLFSKITEAFGQSPDLLVHNAGMSCYGEIEECPFDQVQEITTLNYLSGVRLVQLALPGMKKRKSGQIIWIGSGSAIRGIPFAAVYSASKAAAKTFCESIRGELRDFHIDVLSVTPGALDTGFHASQTVYSQTRKLRRTGTPQSPETLAEAIIQAGAHRKKELVFGRNVRMGRHLAYWSPRLLDYLYRTRL